MIKKWLSWINLLFGGIAIALVLAGFSLFLLRPGHIPVLNAVSAKSIVPKSSFVLPQHVYDAIGEPTLALKYAPMTMQLPDLKRFLIYYGKNGRPDADPAHPHLHFAFTGNKLPHSVTPGQRLYLVYDKKTNPPQYVFSTDNAETGLWIEPNAQGNEALVNVGMKGENGETITHPAAYASFTVPEKEYARFGGGSWEIGKYRVDGTILARQRARWYGKDLFLEHHGGTEFSNVEGKQRIDFSEGEEAYSVFAGLSDALMWHNDRWNVVKPGPDSLGHPLMVVKKVDERLMNLELWDVEGKGKMSINLLKSSETWMPQNLQQAFKFVGARTRSQFVFEVNKERMLLSPQDWLVMTEEGWKKLVTPQEIDEYVDRKLTGALFVFDGIQRKEDHQVLVGTMYNASRTDAQPVEILVQQGGQTMEKPKVDDGSNPAEDNDETPYAKIKTDRKDPIND